MAEVLGEADEGVLTARELIARLERYKTVTPTRRPPLPSRRAYERAGVPIPSRKEPIRQRRRLPHHARREQGW